MPGGAKPAGMAIAAMVLGILCFLICWVPVLNWVTIVIAILAIVLGVIARKKVARGEADGAGMALTGMILGIVWSSLFLIGVVVLGMIMGVGFFAAKKAAPQMQNTLQQMQQNFPATTRP